MFIFKQNSLFETSFQMFRSGFQQFARSKRVYFASSKRVYWNCLSELTDGEIDSGNFGRICKKTVGVGIAAICKKSTICKKTIICKKRVGVGCKKTVGGA